MCSVSWYVVYLDQYNDNLQASWLVLPFICALLCYDYLFLLAMAKITKPNANENAFDKCEHFFI